MLCVHREQYHKAVYYTEKDKRELKTRRVVLQTPNTTGSFRFDFRLPSLGHSSQSPGIFGQHQEHRFLTGPIAY